MNSASPSRARTVSVVIALGETTNVDHDIVVTNADVIEHYGEAELVVVDDMCPEPLRAALSDVRGVTRVLHLNPAHGTLAAVAAGAQLVTGSIVLFAAPDVELNNELLDAMLAPFAGDPGIGFVTPTLRYWGIPPDLPQPSVPPLIAIRRNALESVGGVRAISASNDDHAEKGTTLSETLLERIHASGWRHEPIATQLDHRDGLIDLWDDKNASSTTKQLYWNPPFHVRAPRSGVNVVGLLDAACGIGMAARRYIEAIATTNISYATFAYHGHGSPELDYAHHGSNTFAYDTNLLALNADLLPSFGVRAGRELWSPGHYTIGLWFWELEQLSPAIKAGFAYVNEVWAASKYIQSAFASAMDKPVITIPMPIAHRDGPPRRSRRDLGLPDRFTFLSTFDFGSMADRKNSTGVIDAFCRAFEPGEGPVLVLKTLNASWDRTSWQQLRHSIAARRDVRIVDGYMDDEVLSEMIGSADCYVSLHRAEGFGLTPAEAMAWGRPVIATGYSGNLDYMNDANSYLVPFTISRVHPRHSSIYPRHATWAEPSIDIAAQLMRQIYEHPNDAAARGREGQRDIRRSHGMNEVARAIANRFGEIDRMRGRPHQDRANSRSRKELTTSARNAQ